MRLRALALALALGVLVHDCISIRRGVSGVSMVALGGDKRQEAEWGETSGNWLGKGLATWGGEGARRNAMLSSVDTWSFRIMSGHYYGASCKLRLRGGGVLPSNSGKLVERSVSTADGMEIQVTFSSFQSIIPSKAFPVV